MLLRFKILYEIYNNKLFRVSVNYLVGFKYFYGYKIILSYPILIPRIDTEMLVSKFKDLYIFYLNIILDAGCGSGLIGNIISKFLYKIFLIDFSYFCIKLSIQNINASAKNFFNIDWLNFLLSVKDFDIILSNPSYISKRDIQTFIFSKECIFSLLSGKNGLYDIYNIIFFSYSIINVNSFILLEHSYKQAGLIRMFMLNIGFINVYSFFIFKGLFLYSYGEKWNFIEKITGKSMILGFFKSLLYMLAFYFFFKLLSYLLKFLLFFNNKIFVKNGNETDDKSTLNMLQCVKCKIYIAKSEAYICNGKVFCKKEHSF